MTNIRQDEFLQTLDGGLTPQQAALLLEMGDEGDTGDALEMGGVPDASAVEGASDAVEGDAGENGSEGAFAVGDEEGAQYSAEAEDGMLNANNAVIVAKDGVHHISYDKLIAARDGEKQAKAALEYANRKAAEAEEKLQWLQANADARADLGQAATRTDHQVAAAQAAIDQGIDPAIFGDFSEEGLANGIATLVSMKVSEQVAEALESVDARLAPIQKEHHDKEVNSHFDAIYEAHPDADSIYQSTELERWINSQPSFTRHGFLDVLEQGTTAEVIELFDTFKQATGVTQAAGRPSYTQDEVRAAARQAIAGAKPPPPASLSDIPGGRPGAGASRDEVMGQMTGMDLLEAMDGMSPEQIETFLNRQM